MFRNTKNNNKKGFTLIELLIVIAIIGLLSTLAVAVLTPARRKARDSIRKQNLKLISDMLERYNIDNNKYPDTGSGIVRSSDDCTQEGALAFFVTWPPVLNSEGVICLEQLPFQTYLTKIPKPPRDGEYYYYTFSPLSDPPCVFTRSMEAYEGNIFGCKGGACIYNSHNIDECTL